MRTRFAPWLLWCRRRSTGGTTGQSGQVTAELAVAIVALVAALLPLLAGVQAVLVGARAQEGARAVAREIARGEDGAAAIEHVAASLPGGDVSVESAGRDAVVAVRVMVPLPFGARYEIVRSASVALEPS
ncbi:MAG: hypothetical protein KDC23_08000 [Actinobacteria bacterium]|nr:hypothetical protein [Actinomycetota bacterium]